MDTEQSFTHGSIITNGTTGAAATTSSSSPFQGLVKLSLAFNCSTLEALNFIRIIEQMDSEVIGLLYARFGPNQPHFQTLPDTQKRALWDKRTATNFLGLTQPQMIEFLSNLVNYEPKPERCNLFPLLPCLLATQVSQLEWFLHGNCRDSVKAKKIERVHLALNTYTKQRLLDIVMETRASTVTMLPKRMMRGTPFKNALDHFGLAATQNGARIQPEQEPARQNPFGNIMTPEQANSARAAGIVDTAFQRHLQSEFPSFRNCSNGNHAGGGQHLVLKSTLSQALTIPAPLINIEEWLQDDLFDFTLLSDVKPRVVSLYEIAKLPHSGNAPTVRSCFRSPGEQFRVMLGCIKLRPWLVRSGRFTSECFHPYYPFTYVQVNKSYEIVNDSSLRNQSSSMKNARWFDISRLLYRDQSRTNEVDIMRMTKPLGTASKNDIFVIFLFKACRKSTETLRVKLVAEAETNVKLVFDQITKKKSSSAIESEIGYVRHMLTTADEVTTDSLQLSLRCPVSQSRIKVPVRGKKCKHIQCFDLGTFIDFSACTRSKADTCPVCGVKKNVDVRDLVYSPLVQSLLEKYPDLYDVYLLPDGSSSENPPSRQDNVVLQVESVDGVQPAEDIATPKSDRKRNHLVSEIVDLTIDEPDLDISFQNIVNSTKKRRTHQENPASSSKNASIIIEIDD